MEEQVQAGRSAPAAADDKSTLRSVLQMSSDWISPVNATVAGSTVVLDLFAPLFGHTVGRLAAIAGGACVLVLLYSLVKLEQRRKRMQPISSPGAFYGRCRKLWFVTVACLGGLGMASGTISHADQPNPSALGSAFPQIAQIQQTLASLDSKVGVLSDQTKAIQDNTAAIRDAVAPQDARGKLSRLGYGIDDESKARAVESCDVDALTLYAALHETMPLALPIFGKRGGSTLEAPILSKNPHFAEALNVLSSQPQFDKRAVSTPYLLTFTQAQTTTIPAFDGLLAKARQHGVQTTGLLAPMVKASPLAVAAWFGNNDAVAALLKAGADADTPAVELMAPVNDHGNVTMKSIPVSTAREEARRLKLSLPALG